LLIICILKFDFLMIYRQVSFNNLPTGFIGSFFIGIAFSMGLTSCTGLILMIVISLASTNPYQGMILMISYVLGFAISFLVLSFFVGRMNWIKKHSNVIVQVGGYIMILFGIALFFDWM